MVQGPADLRAREADGGDRGGGAAGSIMAPKAPAAAEVAALAAPPAAPAAAAGADVPAAWTGVLLLLLGACCTSCQLPCPEPEVSKDSPAEERDRRCAWNIVGEAGGSGGGPGCNSTRSPEDDPPPATPPKLPCRTATPAASDCSATVASPPAVNPMGETGSES
mmetsp:Transcript_14241/g.30851  ORF Transcript_14241/g.30851 Transcript_14241/m.30851 type:complete len:164 (+) Transcript_14241:779-1270(+)